MKSLLAGALLVAATAVHSQNYPSRPVRIVVPLSPGGFADTPARMLAPRLSEQLGRQFFVENKPGAGGTIGADFVAKSPPDGHTLLVTGTSAFFVPTGWVGQFDAARHVAGVAREEPLRDAQKSGSVSLGRAVAASTLRARRPRSPRSTRPSSARQRRPST